MLGPVDIVLLHGGLTKGPQVQAIGSTEDAVADHHHTQDGSKKNGAMLMHGYLRGCAIVGFP
jgi:hypothetical protein